jgi:surface antigen
MSHNDHPCLRVRGPLLVLSVLVALLLPSAPAQAYTDDYPWKYDTSYNNDSFGFQRRQCVSFAAWRLYKAGHRINNRTVYNGRAYYWNNGAHWDDTARALRKTVTTRPRAGSIAQWNAYERSPYYAGGVVGSFRASSQGHVAWVAGVYSDGSVLVRQYNLNGSRTYSQMRVKAPRYLYL